MIVWLAVLAVAGGLAAAPEGSKELENNVKAYLKVRKEAVAGVPKLKAQATPEEIHAHKSAEAEAIRAARAGAKRGDVLTPPVEAYLKRIVRSEMAGHSGKPAKEVAKQGNPKAEGVEVPVKVNAGYPDSAPLSSVPPTLLLRLPKLPKEVDFRFVGRDLVLRDVGAGIVLDYVPNAVPQG